MTQPVLPVDRPELTVLPACVVAGGKLVRTYPGDPRSVGWTVFKRTAQTYLFRDDPLFESERQALQYLYDRYGVTIDLSKNGSLSTRTH